MLCLQLELTESVLVVCSWRDPFFPNKTDCVLCLCAALQTSQNILWLETWDFSFYSASLRSDDDKAFCTPQVETCSSFCHREPQKGD